MCDRFLVFGLFHFDVGVPWNLSGNMDQTEVQTIIQLIHVWWQFAKTVHQIQRCFNFKLY